MMMIWNIILYQSHKNVHVSEYGPCVPILLINFCHVYHNNYALYGTHDKYSIIILCSIWYMCTWTGLTEMHSYIKSSHISELTVPRDIILTTGTHVLYTQPN